MSEKKRVNTPPVIRVFLSSTFADMEKERSYFNEVLAPKMSRICAERGVSFFNVDLRWGITEEDQIGGQVLPICLGEIDKCRPYFIGIVGGRYGSLMERVPEHAAESIPWLEGKEGLSITELEMLYAVLDHEKNDAAINSAFYFRSDRLSRELYPELSLENEIALGKLEKLKSVIRADGGVLCSDYDSIEEFGRNVMKDMIRWLDENFPESGDVREIRREWYNGEILRGHIENADMNSFLDSYITSSRRPLLLYGDGARGKTAFLTAWEPKNAKKILINCASDEAYRDWTVIALRILSEFCQYLSGEDAAELREILDNINTGCGGNVLGASNRERFRSAVRAYLRSLEPQCRVAVVLNDLNLLSDDVGRLLSWLPSEAAENISFICSTNDNEMTENADVLGWNIKEMPLFSADSASELINNSLRVYGKNLSSGQFSALLSSIAARYPGQLRFVIAFLLNHGRFNNLDRLADDIAEIGEVHGIYRYVFDFLTEELSWRETEAVRSVLGLLRASNIALSENECFELAKTQWELSPIEWASICRIFEQFELIHGDYWYIRNEETEKFIDELLSNDEMNSAHKRLAIFLFDKLIDGEGHPTDRRASAAAAKQMLESLRTAGEYGTLVRILGSMVTVENLIDIEPSAIRSAWLELFMETDLDVGALLIETAKNISKVSRLLAVGICRIIKDLDMPASHAKACEALGIDTKDAVSEVAWEGKLSRSGIDIYNKCYRLKKAGKFRELSDYTAQQLASPPDELNDTDLCKLLFFKSDAEAHLDNSDASLTAANEYYKAALKAGEVDDMRFALNCRAAVLYNLGKIDEALKIISRCGKMAFREGMLREHLASLNLRGMCCYRIARYDESIAIFDKLFVCWTKTGDKKEVCSTVLNKCNALYLSDRISAALEAAEKFFRAIDDGDGFTSSRASFCGNIGLYALRLGLYEKAEEYLTEALRISSEAGAEGPMVNAYDSLAEVYEKTDSFRKGIALYNEQMEFHWRRGEYEKVMSVYRKTYNWFSSSNYKKEAAELEAKWKERFSGIKGGLEYFGNRSDRSVADTVTAEKMLEAAKIAASEGDMRREAEIYRELAGVYENDDPVRAANYLVSAAMNYYSLDDTASRLNVLEAAMKILFDRGQIADIMTYDNVIVFANDEDFEGIAVLWRELGDMAYAARMEEEGKMLTEGSCSGILEELVGKLMRHRENNEYLAVCCISDLAEYLAKSLSRDAILTLISYISDDYRGNIINRFNLVMGDEMSADTNYLMQNYFGARADKLIARYEKYTEVLTELDGPNAPAIAGNLALIFRRRKEKEKTLAYHKLAADLFRAKRKMSDCFIEIMNGATAHKEFSEFSEAIALLRNGLEEALGCPDEQKYAAMIAGNLAAMLIHEKKSENSAETERCFAIEEEYFRKSGYHRDLEISLVNQCVYYVNSGAPLSAWVEKLKEARHIADTMGLGEFSGTLSKLEWRASRMNNSDSISEDAVRMNTERVFSENGYTMKLFQRTDEYYYTVAFPATESKLYDESVHAAVPLDGDFRWRIIAESKPVVYIDSAELERYIEWWNALGKYTLSHNLEEHSIRAFIDLSASSLEQFSKDVGRFAKMWSADKINCVGLVAGLAKLDECRENKLKALAE